MNQTMSRPSHLQTPPHDQNNMMPNRPSTCAFPAPPVRSVYCEPAAFSQVNGQRYQKIVYAYGKSRPLY